MMVRMPPFWILRYGFIATFLVLIIAWPFWMGCCQMAIGLAYYGYSSLPSWIAEPEVNETTHPISRPCPTVGIKKVILRAAHAETCKVIIDPEVEQIEIKGLPAGGARGYHPIDRNWRETPPSKWGFEFAYKRYGDLLVISTRRESHYIHHHYVLTHLELSVPQGVEVVREKMTLNGKGRANLDPPSP